MLLTSRKSLKMPLHVNRIDHLIVLWRSPTSRQKFVIGHLTRGDNWYRFWYESQLPRDFILMPSFPTRRTESDPYVAAYLWPVFNDRIPNRRRSDTAEFLHKWNIADPDDKFEILAKSHGVRATDFIELAAAQ